MKQMSKRNLINIIHKSKDTTKKDDIILIYVDKKNVPILKDIKEMGINKVINDVNVEEYVLYVDLYNKITEWDDVIPINMIKDIYDIKI